MSSGEPALALSFRRAEASDLATLRTIDAESPGGGWSEQAFAEELRLSWSRFEVAVSSEGRIAGFMVYWEVAGELELLNIASHPALRRQGVGRALLARLLGRAKELGAQRVLLEVRRSNSAAQALYRWAGFVETGTRIGYYQHGHEDAVLMEWRPGGT